MSNFLISSKSVGDFQSKNLMPASFLSRLDEQDAFRFELIVAIYDANQIDALPITVLSATNYHIPTVNFVSACRLAHRVAVCSLYPIQKSLLQYYGYMGFHCCGMWVLQPVGRKSTHCTLIQQRYIIYGDQDANFKIRCQ